MSSPMRPMRAASNRAASTCPACRSTPTTTRSSARDGEAGERQPFRARPQDPASATGGDLQPRRLLDRDPRLSGDGDQRPARRAARLSRQCRARSACAASRPISRRGRPSSSASMRRRLHRRPLRQVHRRALPAGACGRHHRRRRPDAERARDAGRHQPGQLRHFGPMAAGHLALGRLLRRRISHPGNAVRRSRAISISASTAAPLEILVQPVALALHRRRTATRSPISASASAPRTMLGDVRPGSATRSTPIISRCSRPSRAAPAWWSASPAIRAPSA